MRKFELAWRARLALMISGAVLMTAACWGGGNSPGGPHLSHNDAARAAAPAVVDTVATGVERTPRADAPPCVQSDLVAAARDPVGATAMMTLSMIVANVGAAPCRLPPPEKVEFLFGDGTRALAVPGPEGFNSLVLDRTRPPVSDEPYPPTGAAYMWMVWSWRAPATCHVVEPARATVRVHFPGELTLEAPADIRLAPCEGRARIGEFGLVRS